MEGWLGKNLSLLVSLFLMAGGGYASYLRLQDQVAVVGNKVSLMEREGTEITRNLQKKVQGLETQNNELATQMREQKEVLTKIDKRVGYLLCKTDRRFCVD